jgi:hypothetical protein
MRERENERPLKIDLAACGAVFALELLVWEASSRPSPRFFAAPWDPRLGMPSRTR